MAHSLEYMKVGFVDDPDMGDWQMVLDGVFPPYASNLPQPHSSIGRLRNKKKIES